MSYCPCLLWFQKLVHVSIWVLPSVGSDPTTQQLSGKPTEERDKKALSQYKVNREQEVVWFQLGCVSVNTAAALLCTTSSQIVPENVFMFVVT